MKIIALLILYLISILAQAADSVCFGSTGKGRLENAVKLPSVGANFESYGSLPELAGRTYVHSKVRDTLLEAYGQLEKAMPGKVFKYAETGLQQGGEFKPHKTHQNGLSVDFMVPVVDEKGRSVQLPTHAFNKYGYDIEFDSQGRYENYQIDFEAMAAHLVALHRAAQNNGIGIWRVIFAPELQPLLYASTHGKFIQQHIDIPNKRSWVRHDEHYHVDFKVTCRDI